MPSFALKECCKCHSTIYTHENTNFILEIKLSLLSPLYCFSVILCRQNILELSDEGRAACLPALCHRRLCHCCWPRPFRRGPVSSVWRHSVPQRLLPWTGLDLLPQHPVLRLQARKLSPARAGDEHDHGEAWWLISLKLIQIVNTKVVLDEINFILSVVFTFSLTFHLHICTQYT